MADWRSGKRISKKQIPIGMAKCPLSEKCPASKAPQGFCENPQASKKTPESLCHKMLNKNLMAILETIPQTDSIPG